MAKFYGMVGYVHQEETKPGVWKDIPVEKSYFGDVTRNTQKWQGSANNLNDNFTISNIISIVGDQYSYENIGFIRYIEWMGSFWEVSGVEIQRPRLVLTIGGVYNGPRPETA